MTTPPAKPESGLPSHVAAALAYVGGALTGIVMLVMEKKDPFVRFHAMQSTITFLAVLVAHLLLRGLPLIGRQLSYIFVLGVIALWIYLMVQAFTGRRYKLPYIGDFAERQLR